MNIEKEIYERLLFFDGAMGTTLQKKGLKTGEVPEKLNFTHPELSRDLKWEKSFSRISRSRDRNTARE